MKIARRRLDTATIPAMAMGDIAFLLLIFFVILARAQDDSHLRWEPASAAEVERAGNARASVVIDAENRVHLNGQEVGTAVLASAIEEQLGDAPKGKRTVLLKAHRDATAIYFEPVIEAISEAGGDLVHILEEERE